jgi:cytochrome c peroxidase
LEEQVLMPVMADNEMHSVPADVVKLIDAEPEYRAAFKTVFGDETVSMDRIAKSIATFERTITAGRSKFDEFISGHDPKAMDDDALRGMQLFRTTARCINCHDGPNFSDGKFHSLGLTYYGRKLQDLGRYNVTKDPADMGRFRTPSLRNIARTAPYMHNGLFELPGVLNIYNAGGVTPHRTEAQQHDPTFPRKDSLLHPLGLDQWDKDDLIAFLNSLTEPKLRLRPPPLPGLTKPTTQDSLPP